MAARYKIGSAPNGEDTSADGTEKFPVSGSKYMLISTVAAYIRTLTQTLTGKTINLTDNTLTGTKAQFNTAMSDADFATLTGTETLTNKTLTAPVISTISNTGTLTLPTTTDTIVGRSTTDTLTNKTLTTPTISGAITFPDNTRQTFNPGADAAGLNVGSHAGDPGTPSNGDVWYDSTANELTARINGANVALGSGGGSVATDTIWDAKGDVAGGTGANTAARLAVGTDGQVLTADAAEATGLKWTTPGAGTNVATDTIWDAKGDLAGGTGSNTAARLAVGANGTYLTADSAEATGLKWASGARVLIESATPTGTGTKSFSSISSAYSRLILEYVMRGTAVATSVSMDITLNNDTTDANYRRQVLTVHTSTTVGGSGADDNVINDAVIASTGPASEASYGRIEIPFYAGTTFFKQIRAFHQHRRDTSSVQQQEEYRAIDWESTSAVNRVDLILASGNFDTGTTINLYGEY